MWFRTFILAVVIEHRQSVHRAQHHRVTCAPRLRAFRCEQEKPGRLQFFPRNTPIHRARIVVSQRCDELCLLSRYHRLQNGKRRTILMVKVTNYHTMYLDLWLYKSPITITIQWDLINLTIGEKFDQMLDTYVVNFQSFKWLIMHEVPTLSVTSMIFLPLTKMTVGGRGAETGRSYSPNCLLGNVKRLQFGATGKCAGSLCHPASQAPDNPALRLENDKNT